MHTGSGTEHSEEHSAWYARMAAVGDEQGRFERLGPDHAALFIEQAPTLLVTFESADTIRNTRMDQMPLAATLVDEAGWSQLTLMAEGETWFRDPAVYAFFDRLVDEAFFEDFDRVVFYGADMGGYAAAAFSVAAPGATVIALAPQATLDPRVCEWDDRFFAYRRLNFSDRYGYAPDMIDAAERAYILYDPQNPLDAMHAALFTRANAVKLRCRHFGATLETDLLNMGVLTELIDAACEGQMSPRVFHQLLRARRDYLPYLRHLLVHLERSERPYLAALLCRSAIKRTSRPRFRKRLEELKAMLAEEGHALPPEPAPEPAEVE
ncbi:phosphoadenosine phosphosulfate reductase [Actibacterium sp. MT2.3-13A]|uniref:phosphoadenosine phosphosulfate reductase n=1 Tax=Actibacterium sp. MT2.3-13A TaxID=2828332 RepID=UPI001BADAB65|nr:phosphoadenosine phosphosulfate reductase [Actibacterium sp. MT2.3-13A]